MAAQSKKRKREGDEGEVEKDGPLPKKNVETTFLGLINQGNTCYINALLQTLFHIPYFRKAVYEIQPSHIVSPSADLALSLQKIFYELQFHGKGKSVSTEAFTGSSGWKCNEQHDIQEFDRRLCEQLTLQMQGPNGNSILDHLFGGQQTSYFECIHHPYKSEKAELFYDIQLDVVNCPDVYASFNKYTRRELLDGDNRYHTEDYGLQDATKTVLFDKFPRVLQLHLKRFEYDKLQGTTNKVNDYYEFPLQLDLGKYLSNNGDKSLRNLYALHSVLVHQGDYDNGHYYALIRPYLLDQWYKFEDEIVTKVKDEVLEDAFGGLEKTTLKKRDANAYMLVYIREDDKEEILCQVNEDNISEHLKERMLEFQKTKGSSLNVMGLQHIPPPDTTEEDILLFFKLYEAEKCKRRSVGSFNVKSNDMPYVILSQLNKIAGYVPDQRIYLFKEMMSEPYIGDIVDQEYTFQHNEIRNGDVIWYGGLFPFKEEYEDGYWCDSPFFLKEEYKDADDQMNGHEDDVSLRDIVFFDSLPLLSATSLKRFAALSDYISGVVADPVFALRQSVNHRHIGGFFIQNNGHRPRLVARNRLSCDVADEAITYVGGDADLKSGCRGLLCLARKLEHQVRYIIVNPFYEEFTPTVPVTAVSHLAAVLAFEPSELEPTLTYRLVCPFGVRGSRKLRYHIYSSVNMRWRTVRIPADTFDDGTEWGSGLYCDGCVCWKSSDRLISYIIDLDVHRICQLEDRTGVLGTVRGQLCHCFIDLNSAGIIINVLENSPDNTKSRWLELRRICCLGHSIRGVASILSFGDELAILRRGERLFLFDLTTGGDCRLIKLGGVDDLKCIPYLSSMAKPSTIAAELVGDKWMKLELKVQ